MMLLLCIFSGMNFGMNSKFWGQFWYEKNQPSATKLFGQLQLQLFYEYIPIPLFTFPKYPIVSSMSQC